MSVDVLTVVIESLPKGRLREQLTGLREEVKADPYAVALLCEFQPQRAEQLIYDLLGVLCER